MSSISHDFLLDLKLSSLNYQVFAATKACGSTCTCRLLESAIPIRIVRASKGCSGNLCSIFSSTAIQYLVVMCSLRTPDFSSVAWLILKKLFHGFVSSLSPGIHSWACLFLSNSFIGIVAAVSTISLISSPEHFFQVVGN